MLSCVRSTGPAALAARRFSGAAISSNQARVRCCVTARQQHCNLTFGSTAILRLAVRSQAVGIDFERYPIADLASPAARKVVAKARADLAATGCASFPGFLLPEATALAAAQAAEAAPHAFVTDDWHNAYQVRAE